MSDFLNYPSNQGAYALQQQQADYFRSSRMGEAMKHIDRYVSSAAEVAVGRLMRSMSAEEARRQMNSTMGGQAARDFAMMQRANGSFGHGNPLVYGDQIFRGIASGFTVNNSGMMGGRPVATSPMRVAGVGMLQEQVSMNMAKNMLTDLYGGGMTDPQKLYGFKMDDAAQVFNRLASRGAFAGMPMATITHGAGVMERLKGAQAMTVSEKNREVLRKAQESIGNRITPGMDISGQNAILNEYANTVTDAESQAVLRNVAKVSTAVTPNRESGRKAAAMVKETIKGLSALQDIYKGISGADLMAKFEEVSGQLLTGNTLATRRSAQMVSKLAQAATQSGIDPGVYMDRFAADSEAFGAGMNRALGLDARDRTKGLAIEKSLAIPLKLQADSHAKQWSAMAGEYRDKLGIDIGQPMTADEIFADKSEGAQQFAERHKAVMMAKGSLGQMSEARRKQAEAGIAEFENAGTDPKKRWAASKKLEAVLSRHWGTSFAAGATSGLGKGAETRAIVNDPGYMIDQLNEMREGGLIQAPITEAFTAGGADAKFVQEMLSKNIGPKGLLAAAQLGTPEAQRAFLREKGAMTEEQAAKFAGSMFGDRGGFKNADISRGVTTYTGAMRDLGSSFYARELEASERFTSKRGKLAKDGAISVRSIADAFLNDKLSINDPETLGLALQQLKDEGISAPALKDERGNPIDIDREVQGGIDFSKDINEEGLKKVGSATAKNLSGLFSQVNNPLTGKKFTSQAEFLEASKRSGKVRQDAIDQMELVTGANLAGDRSNLFIASDRAMTAASQQVGGIRDTFLRQAAVRELTPGAASDAVTGYEKTLAGGGKIASGEFKAGDGTIDKLVEDLDVFGWLKGKTPPRMGAGFGKMMALKDTILKSKGSPELQTGLSGVFEDPEAIAEELDKESRLLKATSGRGYNSIEYTDLKTGKAGNTAATDELVKSFAEAADLLREISKSQADKTPKTNDTALFKADILQIKEVQ